MKKSTTFLTVSLLLMTGLVSAQVANFEWAAQMGSTEHDYATSMATDANNNVFIVSNFRGTVDFNPGAGTENLTSFGDVDIALQKLDVNGNLLWVKQLGGSGSDIANCITIDNSGALYITGKFYGTTDFDPSAATSTLSSNSTYDIFVLKLSANGDFIWVKGMGGFFDDVGNAITTDSGGNVYTIGSFGDVVDFNPGSGTANLSSPGNSHDVFVQKLNSNGEYQWAKRMGGTDDDYGYAIDIDGAGNVYTFGDFQGTADFDPGSGNTSFTAGGTRDIFLQKMSASGDFIWAKQIGGTNYDVAKAMTIDAVGTIIVTGAFAYTVDFDPNSGTANLTSSGDHDVFIAKYNNAGSLTWAKHMGGTDTDVPLAITTDASGNIYSTGYFEGTGDFNPGSGTSNLTSNGDRDTYIQKLDGSGNFQWVKHIGGAEQDNSASIAVDGNDNVYTTGYFSGVVDFNPNSGIENLTSNGSRDSYILKLNQLDETGINENDFGPNVAIYPNPSNGKFAIDLGEKYSSSAAVITDLSGKVIQSTDFNQVQLLDFNLNVIAGVYLVNIIAEGKQAVIRIIIE